MNKFTSWLNSNPSMATKLAMAVGVNRTSISNCKNGLLLMPTRWMPVIVEMSGGALDYETLVTERENVRKTKLSDAS